MSCSRGKLMVIFEVYFECNYDVFKLVTEGWNVIFGQELFRASRFCNYGWYDIKKKKGKCIKKYEKNVKCRGKNIEKP